MVVALQANYLEVELDDPIAWNAVPSALHPSHQAQHRGAAVHVGDRVTVEAIDPPGPCGRVRLSPAAVSGWWPPVANASCVLVALAAEQPAFDADQASRFCSPRNRPVCPCSWCSPRATFWMRAPAGFEAALAGLGLTPLCWYLSRPVLGMDPLRALLASQAITVVCGPSGWARVRCSMR